jgi:FAD:protein FMN transferase
LRNYGNERRWILGLILIVVLTLFWGMREQAVVRRQRIYHEISGEAMGTFYHIKLAYTNIAPAHLAELDRAVAEELARVERSMSTYIADSEISAFNRSAKGELSRPSPLFLEVLKKTLEICELSGGVFDPTVGPLVNLWGFGSEGRRSSPPSEAEIADCLRSVGWRKIELSSDGTLTKTANGLKLSLGAIAKGYAVDRVARLIASSGVANYMVEVGGEVYAAGLNSSGSRWRIGIEPPAPSHLPGGRLRGVVEVSGLAVATSGDYRNYFQADDGKRYSHIIDPRTGRPLLRPPSGVTVLAADCATADALATALFVLGEKEGLELVEDLAGVEALFIVQQLDGSYREFASSGFAADTDYRQRAD